MDYMLQQALDAIRQLDGKVNSVAGSFRQQLDRERAAREQALNDLAKIAGALHTTRRGGGGLAGEANLVRAAKSQGGSPGVLRIEDIPGTRIPFVLLVEIPIGANTTSIVEESVLISQEGPFVAVKRMAAFLSQHSFTFTDPETSAQSRFNGRSYGRWRPIHSAADALDSQHATVADSSTWLLTPAYDAFNAPGTAMPGAVFTPPGAASSFRTMEFDGFIEIIDAGSSLPRQNRPVPSAMWSPAITAPMDLGALDFFERGSVITWRVQPTHPNNPSFGNVDGSTVFPVVPPGTTSPYYPFVAGQFDPHEGIATPDALNNQELADGTRAFEPITDDPITRLPEGILILGYEGYRIIQPAGATF